MKIYFTLFLFFSSAFCYAQINLIDTTRQLKEINVIANRLTDFSTGTKVDVVDSLVMFQHINKNLSDLLSDESPVFIKSYGLGALATSSFRGGSASQTALLWNGFNINSPMNGVVDLSLVPVNFMDAISVQYGGVSALWGSGAVGGAIHLNNTAKFNSGVTTKVNVSTGSFDVYNQQVSFEFSKRKFISSIKLFNTTSKNNFQYNNVFSANDAKVIQTNAELKSYGLLSENYWLIKENQKINLFFWCQHTDRNIPPTMLQFRNESNQIDNNYRITSEWKYEKKKIVTYVRGAYFNESLIYSDKTYRATDVNVSQSIIIEAESKIKLNSQHSVNIGINDTYVTAVASGYINKPQQNRTAFFASYLYTTKNEKLKTAASIRQEIIKNKFVPFTYSAGADYQFIKWLGFKANFSKVYRIPTFNDLYWSMGGNPNLLPENGYSEEAGLKLKLKNNNILFSSDVTVYNRTIKNWIIWLPGISYWSPQNIMSVWSRGMETNSTLAVKLNNFKISISVLTNYVVSTNQQAKSANDASVGKQLIYVPMYSGHAKLSIEYKQLSFSYRHNYTGYRYTSTDNTEYLKPFYLGSLYVSYKTRIKNVATVFYVQVNNIWNEEYQVMLSRAMPQQNFNAGISIEFNKPNNNNN